jgi:hypothetical protein
LRRQNVGNLTKLVGDLCVLLAELALTSSRSERAPGSNAVDPLIITG